MDNRDLNSLIDIETWFRSFPRSIFCTPATTDNQSGSGFSIAKHSLQPLTERALIYGQTIPAQKSRTTLGFYLRNQVTDPNANSTVFVNPASRSIRRRRTNYATKESGSDGS
ncbi:hypothetical protein PM082_009101 [Marasmius tenuissimus]|nr:hypothetical protein PM082_009101 [Marasmius tenuissimus]